MKLRTFAALIAAFGISGTAAAFECPVKIAAAQAAIDNATLAAKGVSDPGRKAEVHMLLDDANMLLHGATHNHEKPQGKLDHARSMAKADAAKGYAEAASVLATK